MKEHKGQTNACGGLETLQTWPGLVTRKTNYDGARLLFYIISHILIAQSKSVKNTVSYLIC